MKLADGTSQVILAPTLVVAVVTGMVTAATLTWIMSRRLRSRWRALHTMSQMAQASQEQAEQSNQAKSEFLAMMSHEIRTPLNSMIGTTELLLQGGLNAHQKTQLRTVMNSAESLLSIINDILDFSKIESGKMALDRLPVDLNAMLEDIAELFASRARKLKGHHRVELVVEYEDPQLKRLYWADPYRLRQVVSNLVSNAVKFTEEGHVILRAYVEAECLCIEVEDTGIGIPPEKQAVIFEKFTQAEGSATTRNFGGTGLGLAICRQLVGLMEGTLTVRPAIPHGSAFIVVLPLKPFEQQPHEASAHWAAALKGRRALIVDGTAAASDKLKQCLTRFGVRSFLAETAADALVTLQQAQDAGMQIDYAFIDAELDDGAGVKLAARLMGNEQGAPRCIIGLAQDEHMAAANSFAAAGCQGYLRKPLRRENLERLLRLLEADHSRFVNGLAFGNVNPSEIDSFEDFSGARVLLVEDNRINRELALEMLAKFSIEADAAENGREALQMVAESYYDLVLMDCMMPLMDGFEASRILRDWMQKNQIPHAPIIALTANAMKGDRERCLEAGMNDYLSKPLRLQDIQEALQRWLKPASEGKEEAA